LTKVIAQRQTTKGSAPKMKKKVHREEIVLHCREEREDRPEPMEELIKDMIGQRR